jgi:hypothetical protein
MAVSKSDLLQFVTQYQQDNKRPCPKAAIIATHGETALDVLKELVDDKSVNCRRGRNGGYYPTDTVAVLSSDSDAPVEAGNAPQSDETVENESNDFAEQFAALEAKLALLSESESEGVPF